MLALIIIIIIRNGPAQGQRKTLPRMRTEHSPLRLDHCQRSSRTSTSSILFSSSECNFYNVKYMHSIAVLVKACSAMTHTRKLTRKFGFIKQVDKG